MRTKVIMVDTEVMACVHETLGNGMLDKAR